MLFNAHFDLYDILKSCENSIKIIQMHLLVGCRHTFTNLYGHY